MRSDRIDEILRSDPGVDPSLGFTERVMAAVRLEAAQSDALGFPWKRLTWGLVACALVTVVALLLVRPSASVPSVPDPAMLTALRSSVWLASSLLGTWVIVWWSLRAAG